MLGKLIIRLITLYQHSLSLLIGNQCRFYPSCSHYTQEAIEHHGTAKGSLLSLRRICSCHPWNEGGLDPVPDTFSLTSSGLFNFARSRRAPSKRIQITSTPTNTEPNVQLTSK